MNYDTEKENPKVFHKHGITYTLKVSLFTVIFKASLLKA